MNTYLRESKSSQFQHTPKSMNDEKNQNTPSETARSKRIATTQKRGKDFCVFKFISESDRLIRYCTRFSSSQDNSESVLETKNQTLHNF